MSKGAVSWLVPQGGVVGRFVKLWATGILLFYAAWFAGYFLVPEGFLREIFSRPRLPLEGGGAAAVGGRIILFNGVVASGLIVVANLFRIKEFPLGYLPVLFHWSLFGVFLGSDSFAYSQGGRLFPRWQASSAGSVSRRSRRTPSSPLPRPRCAFSGKSRGPIGARSGSAVGAN